MKHRSFTLALLGIVACTASEPSATGPQDGGSGEETTGSTGDSHTSGSTGHDGVDGTTTPDASTGGADESGSSGGTNAVCGDGQVSGDEVCDDGINDGSYGSCNSDCTALGPHCGDAQAQGEEACDDGNQTNGDGCNNDCVASGTVLWSRQLAGNVIPDIALDDQDGIAAVTYQDAAIQYYDRDGNPGWSADISGDHGYAIAWHPTEGWAATGVTAGDGGNDVWFRRYDATGDLQASFSYATSHDDGVDGIAFDSGGDIYAIGSGGPNTDRVAWLRKFTNAGAELWNLSIDGPAGEGDRGTAVVVDAFDEVTIAGYSGVAGHGTDLWLRRYDAEKTELWTDGYATTQDDVAYGLSLHPAGGVAVAGTVESHLVMWGARFDDSGLVSEYGGDATDIAAFGRDIAVDSTGAVVLVGVQTNPQYIAHVRKYDAGGALVWASDEVPEGGGSAAFSVEVDSDDAVIVAGSWQEAGGTMDGWIRKYAP